MEIYDLGEKEEALRTYTHFSMLLTDDIQETQLTFHWVRIYLAHIPSAVRLSQLLDVYVPRPVIRMRHADPVVFRNDVIVNGQYRLRVHA